LDAPRDISQLDKIGNETKENEVRHSLSKSREKHPDPCQ
jgi:hypothetical protein